ncbi:MAG TPA: UvrD-helicase domain-containing protein, partial [Polyangiaceae bacterium]
MNDAALLYAFRRNLVLAASAGTGKTHSLVGVLIHALLGATEMGGAPCDPVDPRKVVATTFSRKAAAEIRARVVEELERLAGGDPNAKY